MSVLTNPETYVSITYTMVPDDRGKIAGAILDSLDRLMQSRLICNINFDPMGVSIGLHFYPMGNGGIMLRYSEVECAQPETLDQLIRHRIGNVLRDLAEKYYLK